jgi:hypothetical protein
MEKPTILNSSRRTNSSTGTWAHDRDKVTAENEHMEEVKIWCKNKKHITKWKKQFFIELKENTYN